MIVVGDLRTTGAPWFGGKSCRMTSDVGGDELKSFAASIGLSVRWLRLVVWKSASVGTTENPSTRVVEEYFLLSPRWRARAIAAGAVAVDRRGYVEAVHRARARETASGLC